MAETIVIDIIPTTLVVNQSVPNTTQGTSTAVVKQLFSNSDVSVASTTTELIQVGSMTAPRTVTLPLANSVTPWSILDIIDGNGSVTEVNDLNIIPRGSDTIQGLTQVNIQSAFGRISLITDGVSKWSYNSTLNGPISLQGVLNFLNSTNNNITSVQAGVTAATINYILPITAPSDGQVLSCLADGTMSWINSSASGSAGGDLSGTYPNPIVVNGSNLGANTVPDSALSTNIPIMSFGILPAVDGSLLTNLPSSPPGGSAGGNLSGTYPNPTVAYISLNEGIIAGLHGNHYTFPYASNWGRTSDVVTIHLPNYNPFIVGESINISGMADSSLNGTFQILSSDVIQLNITFSCAGPDILYNQSITSNSILNNVGTVVQAGHGFVVGDLIQLYGTANSGGIFNGIFTLTAVTTNSFSFVLVGANQLNTADSGKSLLTDPNNVIATTSNYIRLISTSTIVAGALVLPLVPVFANNAAAISGGLFPGGVYRTGADPDFICVVH